MSVVENEYSSSDNLAWALLQYKDSKRRQAYILATQYYDGEHRIQYATSKFKSTFGYLFKEFADNLCPAVVEALAERLKVTGWASNKANVTVNDVPGTSMPGIPARKQVTVDDSLGVAAQDLWDVNLMPGRAGEVHLEAAKTGDAYALVWPGLDMRPEIWPQNALEMAVEYDPNRLGVISRACKLWWLPMEKRWRLNIYLPDQIVKYISKDRAPNGLPDDPKQFVPYNDPLDGLNTVYNPYGMPVFHFPNRTCYKHGITELRDVIPLQDSLNKSIMDMLVAMEFASFKQRYIIGMEVETDEVTGEPVDQSVKNYGVDRMMAIPGEKSEVSVGQFEATDLGQFRQVSNDFRAEVARVSGTPLHYFFITTGDFPSGEAIKSAEARFVRRIENRQEAWGPQWGAVMRFALGVSQTVSADAMLLPFWDDASPRSDSELADTAVKKKAVGVSRSQILKELGYSDELIARMLEETDTYDANKAALDAQARGPDISPDQQPKPAGGGGTPAATAAASAARSAGRVPGVKH